MAQAASSSLPLRRTGRKIKPKVDPDFEYDFVQRRIDQLDRELAATGISPRVSQVPSPPGRPSIPLRQMTKSPATSLAPDLTAQTISTELQLAQLQRDKLALELEVLRLRAPQQRPSLLMERILPKLIRKEKNLPSTDPASFVQVPQRQNSRSWSWPTLSQVF